VLVTLRLNRRDAIMMLVLFAAQLVLTSPVIRAGLTMGYLVLAVDILASERWAIPTLVGSLRGRNGRNGSSSR
jgi:hypothetical protein